jgi:hypothetical protein
MEVVETMNGARIESPSDIGADAFANAIVALTHNDADEAKALDAQATIALRLDADKASSAKAGAGTSGPPLIAANGERCPSCGTTLAADQRFCLECGERRGEPRLPFMDGRTQPVLAPQPPTPVSPVPMPRRGSAAAGLSLIAGIGVLLLAMGVGVLIGNSNGRSAASNRPMQVIAAPAVIGATAATGATGSTDATGSTAATAATTVKKQNLPPPVVKVGQPGHGRGYTKGKFTGDFFGQ